MDTESLHHVIKVALKACDAYEKVLAFQTNNIVEAVEIWEEADWFLTVCNRSIVHALSLRYNISIPEIETIMCLGKKEIDTIYEG